MKLTEETKNGVLICRSKGVSTVTRATSLSTRMSHATGPEATTQVVMNLAGLDYLNSGGMEVLLMLAKRLAGLGASWSSTG